MIRPEQLLHPTPQGLYCPPGDFYIDPVRKVDRAVITHGHADHARAGHGAVLATQETLDLMAVRYGKNFARDQQAAGLGETTTINGVSVRLIPAGHVLGSAQVVVEHQGLKMICTGDFKRRPDPTCAPFELERCHVFITEATFALPVFTHPDDRDEIAKLMQSMRDFPGRAHFVSAYSLGKAQRIIALVREAGYQRPILIHKALKDINTVYDRHGVDLGPTELLTDTSHTDENLQGRLMIGPPQTLTQKVEKRLGDPVIGFASGWMRVRARAKASGVELPLVISDHADWTELTDTASDVDPEELWVTHGRADALVRWAELAGRKAKPLNLVGYEDETS